MFLQMCVNHSVHERCIPVCAWAGGVNRGVRAGEGVDRGKSEQGLWTPWHTPPPKPETATETGGKHPTGMHSFVHRM